MESFYSSPDLTHAVADLSYAYKDQAKSVYRAVAMIQRNQCLIQDEIVGLNSGDTVRWAMVTSADIQLDDRKAKLTIGIGTEELVAEIIVPDSASFYIQSTRPVYHTGEATNEGTQILALSHPLEKDAMTRMVILLTPQKDWQIQVAAGSYQVNPLLGWEGSFETNNQIKYEL